MNRDAFPRKQHVVSKLVPLLMLVTAFWASAKTITVTSLDNSGGGTLRAAVANSDPNDRIEFAVTGTIELDTVIDIPHPLTIAGPGARLLTITGNNSTRLFTAGNNAGTGFDEITFSGVTLRAGRIAAAAGFGADARGGALLCELCVLYLYDCIVADNTAMAAGTFMEGVNGGRGQGGAIWVSGHCTVRRCSFSGNRVFGGAGGNDSDGTGGRGGDGAGGAIYMPLSGTYDLRVNWGTFSENEAYGGHGGNGNFGGAGGWGKGGAIYVECDADITASTVSANIGGGGAGGTGSINNGADGRGTGGLFAQDNFGGSYFVLSTLSAGNSGNFGGGPDVDSTSHQTGAFHSGGSNLIGNGDTAPGDFVASGDQVGTTASPINPMLAPLADNGGPTDTMALLNGSPAIDASTSEDQGEGYANQHTRDQRYYLRLDKPDIGAYESKTTIVAIFQYRRVGNSLIVEVEGVPGRRYHLERKLDIGTGNWLSISGVPDQTANSTYAFPFTDSTAFSNPRAFYRARALPSF